jgi:hypothetical protein
MIEPLEIGEAVQTDVKLVIMAAFCKVGSRSADVPKKETTALAQFSQPIAYRFHSETIQTLQP